MKKRIVALSLMCFLASWGLMDIATALAQAWTKVEIAVPAYGYFAKHGHCKTEDMVLYQTDYPDSITWKCYHIDRF